MGIPIFLEVGNSVFRPLAFSTFHPLGIPIFRSLRNSSYHFQADLVEAVVLMPDNLFYNTPSPGIILVINKNKTEEQKDTVLLINASKLFKKGRPKNFLPEETIDKLTKIYLGWAEEDGISRLVPKDEVVKTDYNLSPSRHVAQNGEDDTLALEDAVVLLKEAEEERNEADRRLQEAFAALGIE